MSSNDPNANRPGYKETKAGWIPEEWECVSLKSLGDLFRGAGITRGQLRPKGVPAVRYGDVYTTEGVALRRYKSFVDDSSALSAKPLCFGDIVFASSGETADEIGKSLVILTQDSGVVGGDTVILRPKKGNPYFLAAGFNTGAVRRTLSRNGQGQSVVHIYKSDLELLNVQFPPPHEQKKIAEILSTCDAAIEKTGALIEAKKRRKQALTHQLLSGEKRLPGFAGEWQEVRLDEVAANSSLRNKGTVPDERLYAVTKAKGLIPMRDYVKGVTTDRCRIVKRDWFAYNPMRLNIGSIARLSEEESAMVSGDYVVFCCNEEQLTPDYLDHLRHTRRWQHYVNVAGNGSVRIRIYFKDLGGFKFFLPPLEEQRRIAEILNACDREITLHRRQLEAIREQKRGLMQKLLTGEVRVKV